MALLKTYGMQSVCGLPLTTVHRPRPPQVSPEDYPPVSGEALPPRCFLPPTSSKRRLGVLGLGRQPEYAFRPEEVAFLAQVANQVAIAVETALAYGQIAALKD